MSWHPVMCAICSVDAILHCANTTSLHVGIQHLCLVPACFSHLGLWLGFLTSLVMSSWHNRHTRLERLIWSFNTTCCACKLFHVWGEDRCMCWLWHNVQVLLPSWDSVGSDAGGKESLRLLLAISSHYFSTHNYAQPQSLVKVLLYAFYCVISTILCTNSCLPRDKSFTSLLLFCFRL